MMVEYFYLPKNSHLIREIRTMGGLAIPSRSVVKGTDVHQWKIVADEPTMKNIVKIVSQDMWKHDSCSILF